MFFKKRSKKRQNTSTVLASLPVPSVLPSAGLPSSVTSTRIDNPSQVTHGLRLLDDDVLMQIFEELQPQHGLRPLSLTCKWLRECVKPVLFRSCRQDALCLKWELFIPRQTWTYIRTLLFYDGWALIDPPHDTRYHVSFPLRQVLSEMPQLTIVRIVDTMAAGVPWTAQEAILSHPQLRTFDIGGTLYRQFGPETVNVPVFTAAPLTSYKQVADDFRTLRYSPADSLLLCVVLQQPQVQASLESLEVPSEFVPLALIAERCGQWPRLRRIALRGENWEDGWAVVELLNQMPALEELVLTLSHSARSDLHRICPPDWTGPLPWPRLKTLSLTYPDPLDPVYSWLPVNLRRLVLHCWPRHYNFDSAETRRTVEDRGWDSPIHDSSAMLNILRQCQCSQLDSLKIEFVAGPEDTQLLRLIAAAFPELSSLTVYRYMPWRLVDGVTQGVAWQTLRPLRRLRYLSIYLDYIETAPLYFGNTRLGAFAKSPHYIQQARVSRTFEQLAGSIARSLGPALSAVSFLSPGISANEWVSFRVERTDGGCLVRLAPDALEGHDFVSNDEPAPPVQMRY